MTKYEIMALAMQADNQFEVEAIGIAAGMAAWLESVEPRLRDGEVAELIRLTGAVYRIGVHECGQAVSLENLFHAHETWLDDPALVSESSRPQHSQR